LNYILVFQFIFIPYPSLYPTYPFSNVFSHLKGLIPLFLDENDMILNFISFEIVFQSFLKPSPPTISEFICFQVGK